MNEQAYPVAVTGLTNLLAKVADLKPFVDRDRHVLARGPDLPQSLADAFLQAGFGRLWGPREYGGAELEPADYLQVSEALSKLDGSLGWCAGISAGSIRLLGAIKTDAASSLSPDQALAVSGSFHPKGTATRDGGGWRVQGHWTLMSLSRYSSLFMLSCIEQGRRRQDQPLMGHRGYDASRSRVRTWKSIPPGMRAVCALREVTT